MYVALESGLPSFTPDFSCPVLLKNQTWLDVACHYPAITVSRDAFQTSSCSLIDGQRRAAARHAWSSNPHVATPAGFDTTRVWACPGSLAATTGILSVPQGTEMFQFPRFPPRHCRGHHTRWWGCPIRRSRDQCLLAAPSRVSSLCHVLLRHAAPRHPPYTHRVFPEERSNVNA
jgi:hypothetical protein